MSAKVSKRSRAPLGAPVPATAVAPAKALSEQQRYEQIAEAAYFLSERRRADGEQPDALLDWLEAERIIDLQPATLPVGHTHGR